MHERRIPSPFFLGLFGIFVVAVQFGWVLDGLDMGAPGHVAHAANRVQDKHVGTETWQHFSGLPLIDGGLWMGT